MVLRLSEVPAGRILSRESNVKATDGAGDEVTEMARWMTIG